MLGTAALGPSSNRLPVQSPKMTRYEGNRVVLTWRQDDDDDDVADDAEDPALVRKKRSKLRKLGDKLGDKLRYRQGTVPVSLYIQEQEKGGEENPQVQSVWLVLCCQG